MDYIGLLTKTIKESKLTYAEITKRCEDDGVPFNDNYISTIKNRASIPSDDISRAIAKACGRHEELLVTQAYYDKAPPSFKAMLDSITKIVRTAILAVFAQKFDKAAMKTAQQQLDEMAVAEWMEQDLSQIGEQAEQIVSDLINSCDAEELIDLFAKGSEAENVCAYIAPDDSMYPTIPEGARIHTKLVALDSLKDGDFICRQKDGDDETYIRQIAFMDDNRGQILLTPLNRKGFKSEIIEASDKRLYEKVVQVVIDFD